jgi:hypothetical protein
MTSTTKSTLRAATAILLSCPFLFSAPILVSISGDTQPGPLNGVPREVNQINTASTSAVDLFDLGDGSQGFLGGLTYRASDGLLYSIANDGFGNNTLASFSPGGAGAFTPASDFLPDGFYYGLTYNPTGDVFYALYTQFLGYVTFVQINSGTETVTPLFDYYPGGFFGLGGMTWGPNGLQGLFMNDQYQFQIFDVDLANQQVTAVGQGFTAYLPGGFYYDPVGGAYYAIEVDNNSEGTLVTLDPTTGGVAGQFGIGQGYYYTNLTSIGNLISGGDGSGPGGGTGPGDGAAVPEPSGWLMLSTGAALIAVGKWARMRR